MVERQLTANPTENSISTWTISRDGKYLAYTDFMSKNLYLLAIDSGEIRQVSLPATYYPADWFPDGNHLLLVGGAGGGYSGDLWKMSTWDSSLRKLWGGNASRAAVSPDGSQIAFMKGGGGVWLMSADGEEPREIPSSHDFQNIAWSATGHRLAYIRSRGDYSKRQVTLETCDLSGGAQTTVLSDPDMWGPDDIGDIAWLPDGRIIYSVYPKNTSEANPDLWAITADPNTGKQSGTATRVAGWKNFQAVDPRASADGKRLIASKHHSENEIYVGSLMFGDKAFTPRRVTLEGWTNWVGSWTQDSEAILFESNRNGRWAIFKQEVDAKTAETLIAGSENNFYPVLSAQGTLLYSATASSVLYEPTDTTMRLMSTPMLGGPRSTLMMGSYYYACGSLPASSCVVSDLKDKQLTFFHLDPVKGKGEEIGRVAGYQSATPAWDFSPDGSKIAIVDLAGGTHGIQILNVADRKVAVLPTRDWKWPDVQQIRWAADGNSLFAVAESASSWALLSINAKGDARVLYKIPMGTGWIASLVPSPDGRSIAFTKRVFVNDVMLLENF
jgi:eukaryotic-like serine/threonine-protein kinase